MAKRITENKIPWRTVVSRNPFFVSQLPLIARLRQIGFYPFKRRWTKRLLKRPARWMFEFAFYILRLGGLGRIEFKLNGRTVFLTFNGRSLHFSSIYAYDQGQVFEPQVMGLLELLIRDKEVFFDIGANWGMEALHAATLSQWYGEIHAFEPINTTFRDLQSLIGQANLSDRVKCHNLALSNSTGSAQMQLSDLETGASKITKGDDGMVSVKTSRLDELQLPAPMFMKLDVEGHEAKVIEGASNTILNNKPFIIFETWNTGTDYMASEATFDILRAFDYVFFRPAWRRIDGGMSSVWPDTQPPTNYYRQLTLIPMDCRLRPFMAEHIDVFACHIDRLNQLFLRFSGENKAT